MWEETKTEIMRCLPQNWNLERWALKEQLTLNDKTQDINKLQSVTNEEEAHLIQIPGPVLGKKLRRELIFRHDIKET
jgi:hypothetical protein